MHAIASARTQKRLRSATHDWTPALHMLALWTFAVAQPTLDLIGREPDFLVAQRLTGAPLVVLAVGSAIVVPLLLAAPLLARRLRTSLAMRIWADATRAVLAAAFILQSLHWLPAATALVLATIGGAGLAYCLNRFRPFSNLVAVSAVAAIVAPAVFLLRPGVRGLLATAPVAHFQPDATIAAAPSFKSDVPIVLLVFDELPTSSLQRRDGSFDECRFPAFAALAEGADWYPHAATAGQSTPKAIPALLTGRLPRSDSTAHYNDHTSSLFAWLASRGGYRIVAHETVSRLCPPALCGEKQPNPWRRLPGAADDLTVVYGHLLLPPAIRTSLPSVSHAWTGFRVGRSRLEGARGPTAGTLDQDVPRLIDDFLERVEEGGRGPVFHYLHLNLPHRPWKYLPSGREYTPAGTRVSPPGFEGPTVPDNEQEATHGLQRHLLQVGYADRVLGRILDRLKDAGIYDRALIVVVADHGHSFRPGQRRRVATATNVEDVLEVPLLVKRPGQTEGTAFRHVVQTIDIVPTIAAEIGVRPPWPVDGRPLDDHSPREIRVCCFGQGDTARTFRTDPVRRQQTLDRLARLFGGHAGRDHVDSAETSSEGCEADRLADPQADPFRSIFEVGPRPDLLGKAVKDLVASGAGGDDPAADGATVLLDGRSAYRNVRPETGFVPSQVSGRIEPGTADGTQLAISVDGTIRATTETFTDSGTSRFAALIEERWLPPGNREIGVYAIGRHGDRLGGPRGTLLVPLLGGQTPQLAMQAGRLRGVELAGGQQFLERADHLFQADIEAHVGGFTGRLLSRRGEPLRGVDEFFVFGGGNLLYRGPDDRARRRLRLRGDDREQLLFRVYVPAALLQREPLRLLARSGEQVQQLHPPQAPATFELSRGDEDEDVLLRRTGSATDSGVERIPVQPRSADRVAGFVEGAHRADASIRGWAADLDNPGSTLQIVAFLAGQQFWTGPTHAEREGVAERYGPEHLYSGFRQGTRTPTGMDVAASETLAAIRREGFAVYAVSPQGVASRLRFFHAPLEKENDAEILPVSDGRRLIVRPAGHGFGGAIDVMSNAGRRTLIEGWAGDLERSERPRQIVIYRDGAFLASLAIDQERPDVAEHHGDERLLRTGFQGAVPRVSDPETFAETHRVFAIMLRGVAVELPNPGPSDPRP